jgi:hypothetical protein
MRTSFVLAASALVIVSNLQAQTPKAAVKPVPAKAAAAPAPAPDPVLLTIGGKAITKSEFVSIYKKNSGRDKDKEKTRAEEKQLKEIVRERKAIGDPSLIGPPRAIYFTVGEWLFPKPPH